MSNTWGSHKFRSFGTAYPFISCEFTLEYLSFIRRVLSLTGKEEKKTVLSFALAMTSNNRFEVSEDLSIEVMLSSSAVMQSYALQLLETCV